MADNLERALAASLISHITSPQCPMPQASPTYKVGDRVLVKRTSGEESHAFIRGFKPSTGVYTLEIHPGGTWKQAMESMLRPATSTASDEDARIAEAIVRSQETLQNELRASEATVMSALSRAAPLFASFIDENCALVAPGISTEEGTLRLFDEYNESVDDLVISLLSDAGLDLNHVARTLLRMRETSSDAALTEQLLALESFELFEDLMCRRNEEMHREARQAQQQQPSTSRGGGASGGASSREEQLQRYRMQISSRLAERHGARTPRTRFARALREAVTEEVERERQERDEVDEMLGGTGAVTDRPGRMGHRHPYSQRFDSV